MGYLHSVQWQIETEAADQEITGTTLLAVDIDPRIHTLRLGLRIRTGGEQALWNGAMVRRFLMVESIHWPPIAAWLSGEEATALLDRIDAGYVGSQLWSGDWLGQWSEDARMALDSLHAAVGARCAPD